MRTDTTTAVLRITALIAAVAVLTTGCAPKEDQVTPEEARDTLVTITTETATLVESVSSPWSPTGDPSAGSCNGGLNWDYAISAPPPDADRIEDAEAVADYWKSLGMDVRVQTDPDPVVYGTGGPLKGISFETGPGLYSIGGTSLCAPGDPDDYR